MSGPCNHIDTVNLVNLSSNNEYIKEECYFCFDNQDTEFGVNICLSCLFVGCVREDRSLSHSNLHFNFNPSHSLVLNLRRKVKNTTKNNEKYNEESELQPKLSKLVIEEEELEPEYEEVYTLRCLTCSLDIDLESDNNPKLSQLKSLVTDLKQSTSSSKKEEIKSWEATRFPCEHILTVEQSPEVTLITDTVKCNGCDLTQNLWACLTCGNLGCGRKQFDGSGGNGHGLDHYKSTGHSNSVKLGTITAEGEADIYCYVCDDEVQDPSLHQHLAHIGINLATQVKNEKSMAELQLELNTTYDFSMVTDDGKDLESAYGPGTTGLMNLGNSCYLASVLQVLFTIPSFKEKYLNGLEDHLPICTDNPINCVYCQTIKLASGLTSGRYSQPPKPVEDERQGTKSNGIKPTMFKRILGKGHPEFSTNKQQDAYELFQHLLLQLEKVDKKFSLLPTTNSIFEFQIEHQLTCQSCTKSKYSVDTTTSLSLPVPAIKLEDNTYQEVDLQQCFDIYFAEEHLEGYNCPQCKTHTVATKVQKLKTFPQVLVLHLKRFALVNWVPTKLEIPINTGNVDLTTLFEKYKAGPRVPIEQLLPEDDTVGTGDAFVPNPELLNSLMSMGFSENRCIRALQDSNSLDLEVVSNHLFLNLEDPSHDLPLPTPTDNKAGSKAPVANADSVTTLTAMGFTENHATQALLACEGDLERAVDYLFNNPEQTSTTTETNTTTSAEVGGGCTEVGTYAPLAAISHKGPSTHAGHYIAHVKKEGKWVLFNDNKVAYHPDPNTELAYMFFYMRE